MADDTQTQMADEMRRALGGALQQVGSELTKLDRISKDAVGSSGGIGKLDGAFMGVASRLLGPVGLVAGLYQVSNALSKVAADSVQMQSFARNTGLATDTIKGMDLQLQMIGKSSQEAKGLIGNLAGSLNDFNTNREGSSLQQALLGRTGGADLIQKLNAAKNVTEQIAVILKTYQAQPNERQKRGVAEVFGMDPASIEALIENQQRVQQLLANAYKSSEEDLKEYHEASIVFTHNISEAWKSVSGNAIAALNELSGGAEESGETFKTAVGIINSEVDSLMATTKATMEEIKSIREFLEAPWENTKKAASSFFDPKGFSIDHGEGGRSDTDRYPQGDDPMGRDYSRRQFRSKEYWRGLGREGTSGSTDFSGMRRTQNLEEEQVKILSDIRDAVQGNGPLGVSGGFGSDSSGGRAGLGARLGMNSGGSIPDMPGSPRGSTPGVGGARGRVGAGGDPRGMESYIRETAKKYGIDPDTAVAVAKSEGLSTFQSSVPSARGPNGREDSWGAFQLYKGGGLGNEFQKETGLDPADPANEKATIDYALRHASKKGWGAFHGAKNTGIPRFAGIGGETGVTPQPGSMTGGTTFGGDVRERQGNVAAVRKGRLDAGLRTALDYASSKTGLTADVTSGGQRMPGVPGAVGSHRHDHGRAADFNLRDADGNIVSPNDPRAIEFYRRAAQAGVTGGGEGYMSDPNKIHLDRAGGVYAGSPAFRAAIAQGQKEQAEFHQAARERMDAQTKTNWGAGSINAKIDFTNVPNGVRTSVESEGDVFKDLQVSKSRQGEVAGGSPGQPFAGVW